MSLKARKIAAPTPKPAGRARFAEEDIVRHFGPARLARGRSWLAGGAVRIEPAPAAGAHAATLTDGPIRYRIVLKITEGRGGVTLAATCSCREERCDHAAAAALALLAHDPDLRRPVQASFLDGLLVGGTPANEDRAIVYGLDLAEGGLAVSVATEVRVGSTCRLEPGSPRQAADAAAVGPTGDLDRVISRLLGGSGQPIVTIPASQPPLIDLLVKRLLATGRCRWRLTGPTLTKGPGRRIVVEVNTRTEARRFLNLPAQTRIIQGANAWYVDTTDGRLGSALIEEHAFEPAPRTPPPRLAPPRAAAAPVIVECEPEPVLTAASGRLAEAPGETFEAVFLGFDYGGRVVREDDPGQFARLDGPAAGGGGGPEFARRNRPAEERAATTLRGLGLAAVRVTTAGSRTPVRGYAFRNRDPIASWQWLVTDGAGVLRRQGWRVDLGDACRFRIVEAACDWQIEVGEGEHGGNDWFSLDVGIEVEGKRCPLLPILIGIIERGGLNAASAAEGKIHARLDDGRILALPAERVAKFLATLEEMTEGTLVVRDDRLALPAAEVPTLAALEAIVGTRWHGGERLRELARQLRDGEPPPRVEPPPSFHATLRPYQRDGLDWLQFLRTHDLAGILADDMGLGKTAQTLAHIALERHEGRLDRPCLIVVPTSLVPNWTAEAARFVPSLRVLVFHGLDRHVRREAVGQSDLVITTYALLARDTDFLSTREWHLVVLDEAQAIKNPQAKATRAACRLKARHRLCLSGTPVENHLGELWSQFAFLMPGLLGDHRGFTARYRTPIEKKGDEERRVQFARRLRPFLLRRTKAEVATDLPPKTEIVRRVELASDQRDLYETIRLSMHERVRDEIARLGLARSRIVILDALLKLRQACCDPRLVKMESAKRVHGSGKLDTLMAMIPEMVEEGRRILLFSQFTSMLDLVKQALAPTGIPYVELRGQTADREAPVRRFQACEVPLFLISLKAGGRGLNLTAADTVIHYDPWWNPAVEDQATDRAYRIGQDKAVFVYKLIAAGTVEERILEMQARKGNLASAVLNEGAWMGSLSDEDIDYLFDA